MRPGTTKMTLLSYAALVLASGGVSAVPERTTYLLLDQRLVADAENATLAVGEVEKHRGNPLFGEDKLWEKRFDNLYGNVIYDPHDELYKCWYSPFVVDHSSQGMTLRERRATRYRPPPNREMGICYATSRDGITWEKPDLGLVEYEGSTRNNIVWRGPHGAGVFKDPREPNAARRYKTLFQGLRFSVSPDGLRWAEPTPCVGVRVAGDTHNNALWAPTLGRYVGITRSWGDRGRQVARIESADFATWSDAEVVLEGTTKSQQTYAMPVFFYGGVYLGLLAIHDQPSDRVWTELAWSPDTKAWRRIDAGRPLIPCAEQELAYDYGCVYPCAYPVFLKDEIRLYYGGSDYLHFGWRSGSLCLATLRPDGFAGYEPADRNRPAILTTVPIPYAGQTIGISADVAEGGSVRVRILARSGTLLSTAAPVERTVTKEPLVISDPLTDDRIRLQFELDNAKLYAFYLDG